MDNWMRFQNTAGKLMKVQLGWLASATLLLVAYVMAYYFCVESVNSGIYRITGGRWPKTAVYAIGKDLTFGKVRRYNMDGVSHPIFFPINQLDRRLRRSYWLESSDWWND